MSGMVNCVHLLLIDIMTRDGCDYRMPSLAGITYKAENNIYCVIHVDHREVVLAVHYDDGRGSVGDEDIWEL